MNDFDFSRVVLVFKLECRIKGSGEEYKFYFIYWVIMGKRHSG